MMAATLIEENQNSNSPNEATEHRLVRVRMIINVRLMPQAGTSGNQN